MNLPLVYVAPSKIEGAGNGVFVRKMCPKGMRIAHYDGYVKETRKQTCKEQEYAIEYTEGKSLIGYRKPFHPHGVGQLINDYVMPLINPEISSLPLHERVWSLTESFLDYLQKSEEKENIYCSSELIIVTKRKLQANEECYFSYGVCYWIGRSIIKCTDKKILVALHLLQAFVHLENQNLQKENGQEYEDDYKAVLEIIWDYDRREFLPNFLRDEEDDKEYQENIDYFDQYLCSMVDELHVNKVLKILSE